MRQRIGLVAILAAGLACAAATARQPGTAADPPPAPQGAVVDLTGPFHTRSAWRLVVTEGPRTKDVADEAAPGALTLCLREGPAGPCVAEPVTLPLRAPSDDDAIAWEPHYLLAAKPVYPQGAKGPPLLMIVTGSLHSGDGDQLVVTRLLACDAGHDAFRRVFGGHTGHNNNQEIRFVAEGPLRGRVISAEPQQRAPYGYWIVVYSRAPAGDYRPVLRYRSATLYNDGNPLAVIDSEMPTIERRLGLWKPGQPLPAPARDGQGNPCLKPTLRHAELWCG